MYHRCINRGTHEETTAHNSIMNTRCEAPTNNKHTWTQKAPPCTLLCTPLQHAGNLYTRACLFIQVINVHVIHLQREREREGEMEGGEREREGDRNHVSTLFGGDEEGHSPPCITQMQHLPLRVHLYGALGGSSSAGFSVNGHVLVLTISRPLAQVVSLARSERSVRRL